jgi:hypothetical protein
MPDISPAGGGRRRRSDGVGAGLSDAAGDPCSFRSPREAVRTCSRLVAQQLEGGESMTEPAHLVVFIEKRS